MHPDVTPQTYVLPCIAYSRVATSYVPTIHQDAPVAEDVAIELWCMATKRAEADDLANLAITGAQAAQFRPIERRVEHDSDNDIWSTVVTVTSLRPL